MSITTSARAVILPGQTSVNVDICLPQCGRGEFMVQGIHVGPEVEIGNTAADGWSARPSSSRPMRPCERFALNKSNAWIRRPSTRLRRPGRGQHVTDSNVLITILREDLRIASLPSLQSEKAGAWLTGSSAIDDAYPGLRVAA